MQNMIKEIPLQYLTPNQFKRWTASVGFSGVEAAKFNEDELGDSADELFQKEYHWGKEDISKVDIDIEGSEPVRLDSIVVDKLALETRRALHKTPAFQEDSEYMVLLSEHWETRLDENILKSEFKVRRTRELCTCVCPAHAARFCVCAGIDGICFSTPPAPHRCHRDRRLCAPLPMGRGYPSKRGNVPNQHSGCSPMVDVEG